MSMKIIIIPNQILKEKTKPIQKIDKKIKKIINQMHVVLSKQRDPDGVGLSAPQVGIGLSLFVFANPFNNKKYTFINPIIEESIYKDIKKNKKIKKKEPNLEGCLSVPSLWAKVKRFDKIFVRYTNEEGIEIAEWFDGFTSTVIQHEIDHLNGILFTQRALEQGSIIYKEINGKLEPLTEE